MTSPKHLTVAQKATKTADKVERKLRSRCVFVSLIVTTFILYSAMLILNFMAVDPAFSGGLFSHGISNIPRLFHLNFTPSGWAFYIWGAIYLSQLIWVIYSVGLIFRETDNEPAYLNPVVLSPAFFIFFNLSSAFNIGWLFLWDQLLFLASFVFLACIFLSLILALAIVSSRMVMLRDILVDQGRNKEGTFLQITILNSLAMYVTWAFVTTLLNLGIILVYKWHEPISNEGTSILCLSILTFVAVIYIGLDSTLLERFTRYCLTPYAVIIWTLAASVFQNYNPENLSSIMSLFVLGSVSLAFLFKLGLTLYRSSGARGQYRLLRMDRSDNDLE